MFYNTGPKNCHPLKTHFLSARNAFKRRGLNLFIHSGFGQIFKLFLIKAALPIPGRVKAHLHFKKFQARGPVVGTCIGRLRYLYFMIPMQIQPVSAIVKY
jgi:hypothetical protein